MPRKENEKKKKRILNKAIFKCLFGFLLVLGLLAQLNVQNTWALQNNGSQNKICNVNGYRITASNTIEIILDKGAGCVPDPGQFKLYEGVGTTGNQLTVTAVGTGTDTAKTVLTDYINNKGFNSPQGTSFQLTAGQNFVAGKTYTVVMSQTVIMAGTGFTLGHTNSNQDYSFSFTCPDTLAAGSNSASTYISNVTPTIDFKPANNATNVSLEGNVFFTTSVPASNYADVVNGMVLKKDGATVNFADYTLSVTTSAAIASTYACYKPIYNDDHNSFSLPLTQGTSGFWDFNWQPGSTYELSIPAITCINGKTIPAQTLTFTTMSGDVPDRMLTCPQVAATVSGTNATFSWNAAAAGPNPSTGDAGNTGWPAADSYNVYVSTNPYWNFTKLNSSPITGTTYTADVSGLQTDTPYYVRVSALAGGFEGGLYGQVASNSPNAVSFVVPSASVPTTITVNGTTPITIPATSTTASYAATVQDQHGSTMSGEKVTWSLQTPVNGVAIDSTTGVVTVNNTASAGSFTVVAIDGSVTGSMQVTLTAVPSVATTLTVSGPSSITIQDRPKLYSTNQAVTATYAATVTDQDGHAMTGETITWSLQTPVTGVSINSTTGVVTVVANKTIVGNITVVATDGSLTASETVNIVSSRIPTKISILPANPSVIIGQTVKFNPSIIDQDNYQYIAANGDTLSSSVTWSLQTPVTGVSINSSTGVATVDSTATGGKFIGTKPTTNNNAQYNLLTTDGSFAAVGTIGSISSDAANVVIDLDSNNPPAFVSAKYTSSTQVLVTLNKGINCLLPTAPAGFTVMVGGVADPVKSLGYSATTYNHVITLTLTNPITAGQTVTVAYSCDGTAATKISASDSTVLTSFVQPVSNCIPPQLVSATTDKTGSTVTATFDSAMSSTLAAAPAGFTVTADGTADTITGITLDADNTKLDFTLATPVTNGQLLSIAYQQAANVSPGGTVTGANSAYLSTFTASSIINMVPSSVPTVSSIITSGPTHIVVKMNSTLQGTTGDPAAFTVTGAATKPSVTGVLVSGTDVILTLNGSIAVGDTVCVSYSKTGTNNLSNGTEAESFSNLAVTNNIAASASAPNFVSAASNLIGNTITVAFDKNMAKLTSASAGFTVLVDGVADPITAVALNTNPTKIDFLLTNPILNGQTVSLSYTPGTVIADDGGLLAGFSGQVVNNNTIAYDNVATLAGYYTTSGSYGGDNASAVDSSVRLYNPASVAFDSTGNLYIADSKNFRIREVAALSHSQYGISMTAGNIYTVAGTGTTGRIGDGLLATNAQIGNLNAIAVDSSGNIYLGYSGQVRRIDINGIITNFAGSEAGTTGYSGDGGAATSALLKNVYDLAVDKAGNVYIGDSSAYVVRKVNTSGIISTVVGTGTAATSGDNGSAASAGLKSIYSLTTDAAGNVYIGDWARVREIAATEHTQYGISMSAGYIYTLTGNGTASDTGSDGSTASAAQIGQPKGLAIDSAGNLYICESTNKIRKIDASGNIYTVTGTGTAGYTNNNISATGSAINGASKMIVDNVGNLYYADTNNNIIRFIEFGQATVAANNYTVNIGTLTGGSITASATMATTGAAIYLTVAPDPGMQLQAGSLKYNDGTTDHAITGTSFTMPAANVTVTAVFEPIPANNYTVNIGTLTGGSITASPTTATSGSAINLTITPTAGMQLQAGSLKYNDGTTDHAINGTSFTMPAANVTVTAVFEQVPSTVVTLANDHKNFEITGGTQSTFVNVPSGVNNTSLTVASLLQTASSGTVTSSALPALTVSAAVDLNSTGSTPVNVQVQIPQGTTVSAPEGWDGTLHLPTVEATNGVTVTPTSGSTATVNSVLEVGAGDIPLTFNHAVRLLFPGQAGKKAGYARNGMVYPINTILSVDDQSIADSSMAAGQDGYLSVGSDLVIWTKHFTQFVIYTETPVASSGGYSGGSSSSGGGSTIITPTPTPVTGEATDQGVKRLSGLTRVDTALEIAKANFTGKLSNVVLATADNYPDALAGSVLAYKLKAPILLVGSSDTDQEKVLDYMKSNLDPAGSVYILGGTGVVDSAMEAKVTARGFQNIIRLGGTDRYDTSVKIADQLGVKTGTPIVLVSGENYPDALSISSVAAKMQIPILLVQKDGISDAVRTEIAALAPTKIYIIGGQGVISTAIENQAAQISSLDKTNLVRIGGTDRYETSLEVAKYFNLSGQNVCVATGNNFPDALAGSVYAANFNASIILADSSLSENVINYLKTRKLTGVTLFGGEAVVSKDIEQQLGQLIVK